MNGWLQQANGELVAELTKRLLEPKGSFFRVLGDARTQDLASQALASLQADAGSEEDGAIRKLLADLVDELMPKGLGFHDLRLFARTVRQTLVDSMDGYAGL